MKPIETEYKGYRFRSRLEARWAVFFDACGVKWEYEPEGFDLGDGLYYLPDFLLHDVLIRDFNSPIDLWVEVKGQMTEQDAKKIIKFAESGSEGHDYLYGYPNPILIVTNIPYGDDYLDTIDYMRDLAYSSNDPAPFNFSLIDGDYFAAFPVINKQGHLVIMDDNGRCSGSKGEGQFDYEATVEAYRLARQARFEHNGRKHEQSLLKRQLNPRRGIEIYAERQSLCSHRNSR